MALMDDRAAQDVWGVDNSVLISSSLMPGGKAMQEKDGYRLRDVGSLNGTYLNRERIESESQLQNGDELQIGKFKLVFFSGTGGEG